MKIFPAIDLLGGNAVRLTQGDYLQKEVFSTQPKEVLKRFKKCGAECLHLVDLDGAKDGTTANFSTIKQLVQEGGFFVEVGGGIRNEERIKAYLDLGVDRVILGTIAIENFAFVEQMVAKYCDKISVGVDAKCGKVAVNGWKTVTEVSSFDFCKQCSSAGVSTVIYTDIATDGKMSGTNIQAFQTLSQIENLNIVASGGITFYEEIKALKELNLYGAILGKALYKGVIDLAQAIKTAKVNYAE